MDITILLQTWLHLQDHEGCVKCKDTTAKTKDTYMCVLNMTCQKCNSVHDNDEVVEGMQCLECL